MNYLQHEAVDIPKLESMLSKFRSNAIAPYEPRALLFEAQTNY